MKWILHERDGDSVGDFDSEPGEDVWPGDVIVTSDGRHWRVVQADPVATTAELVDHSRVGTVVVESEDGDPAGSAS